MMSKKKYGTGQTKPIAYDLKDIGLQELMAHEAMGHASYAAPQKLMAGLSYDWNDDARSLALVNLIRVGMDYKTFEKVTAHIPLKDKEWATILDTTLRTLLRYKKDNKTFAPTQTEKIIAIQQLVHFGETVLVMRIPFMFGLPWKMLG
jgi:hypothetical protein